MQSELKKKSLSVVDEINFDSDERSTEIDDSDEDFRSVLNTSTSPSIKISQMRLKLPALAMACDRTGISDRSAATIASAILQDVGIISIDTKNNVVDRMKVRRAGKENV